MQYLERKVVDPKSNTAYVIIIYTDPTAQLITSNGEVYHSLSFDVLGPFLASRIDEMLMYIVNTLDDYGQIYNARILNGKIDETINITPSVSQLVIDLVGRGAARLPPSDPE